MLSTTALVSRLAGFFFFFPCSLILRGWATNSSTPPVGSELGGCWRWTALCAGPEQQTLQNPTYGPRRSVAFQVFSGSRGRLRNTPASTRPAAGTSTPVEKKAVGEALRELASWTLGAPCVRPGQRELSRPSVGLFQAGLSRPPWARPTVQRNEAGEPLGLRV